MLWLQWLSNYDLCQKCHDKPEAKKNAPFAEVTKTTPRGAFEATLDRAWEYTGTCYFFKTQCDGECPHCPWQQRLQKTCVLFLENERQSSQLSKSSVLAQRHGLWTTGSWCNGEGAIPVALYLWQGMPEFAHSNVQHVPFFLCILHCQMPCVRCKLTALLASSKKACLHCQRSCHVKAICNGLASCHICTVQH